MDVVSFNSLLKKIVELALSITNRPNSVRVLSLAMGDIDQPATREDQQRELTSTQSTDASISTVNISGNELTKVDYNLGDDWSSEESEEDTDSEDDPEVEQFLSQLMNEQQAPAAQSGMAELFECLVRMKEVFAQEDRDNQELLASQLVFHGQEGNLEEIYALSFNLFEATEGLSCQDDLIQLYLLVVSNIEGWLDVSEDLCKQVAFCGLLLQDINHLVYFVSLPAASSELLQSAIETELGIIYNCARNCVLPEFYYARFAWAKLTTQLLATYGGNTGIRFTCKLLANTFSVCFQQEEYETVLDLTVNDLSVLKAALMEAAKSPAMIGKTCDYQYSALELLTAINGFWKRPSNRLVLADQSLFTAACLLVERGGVKEKVATLKLLWNLLEDEKLKDWLKQQHKNILDLIKLEASRKPQSEQISVWCEGVLAILQDDTIGGETDWLLATIKCCYHTEQYGRCVELCNKVSGVAELQVYQGKALYQIYWRRRRLVQELKHNKQQFYKQHQACYEVAREAMKILGRAKDGGAIEGDVASQKILDTVMIDYILETNRLKEMKRCFLCLQRQQYEKVTAESVHGDKGQVQHKGSADGSIKRSHLIPHGVIKRLALVDGKQPTNPKPVVFGVSGTKLDSQRTPATSTVHMLCGSCEQMINNNGEDPFLHFFKKLIDPALVDSRQELKYGRELYYFCLSLTFRTLCPSQDEYINTDEVYQLLVQCRAYLLSGSSKVDDLPNVLLFIHPLIGDDESVEYKSFVEQSSVSYTSKFALDCKREELDSFESVYANFFLVKMGIVMVVVIFRPLSRYKAHDKCIVSLDGGVYVVPPGSDRESIIPAGVKTALQLLYDVYASDLAKFNKGKSGKAAGPAVS